MDTALWPRVYLAGAILDCTKAEGNDWRKMANAMLYNSSMIGVSPLRCEPIQGERYGFGDSQDTKFGTGPSIAAKNIFDVRRCDATLAFLPPPKEGRTQSYGTIIELAWAFMAQKLVVCVSEDPKIVNHPVIKSCCGWMVPTLKDGVDVLDAMFGAYNGGKNV